MKLTESNSVHLDSGKPESAVASQSTGIVPKWAGQFDSFEQWVNQAQSRLTPSAICVDAKGRRCYIGKDFMRARDESTFPVRYFWEFETAAKPVAPTVEQVEDVVGMGSNAWDCVPPVALIEAVLWCAGRLQEEPDYARQSGISPLVGRPNEKDVVGEGK